MLFQHKPVTRHQIVTAARRYLGLEYSARNTHVWEDEAGRLHGRVDCLRFLLLVARDVGLLEAGVDVNLPRPKPKQPLDAVMWELLSRNLDQVGSVGGWGYGRVGVNGTPNPPAHGSCIGEPGEAAGGITAGGGCATSESQPGAAVPHLPGDVLLMRFGDVGAEAPHHVAIVTSQEPAPHGSMIHAVDDTMNQQGSVREQRIDALDWQRVHSVWRVRSLREF